MIVISHSNSALILALISCLTLLYLCSASSLVTIVSTLGSFPITPLSTLSLFDRAGMAHTRSMTRKRLKTCDDSGSASWSDLNSDLLLMIMMQLGVIDFVSFSLVCKFWRSIALCNRVKFLASKAPMFLSISNVDMKKCYLNDVDGRKFRTNLPHSTSRICVGLTRGFVILFGRKTRDFWLVNPITRHEFHFPRLPLIVGTDPKSIRGGLVKSPSMGGWVLVITFRLSLSNLVSFCLSGSKNTYCWYNLFSYFPFRDLHVFQEKVYTLNQGNLLYEVKLDPKKPTLRLLGMNKIHNSDFTHPEFVCSGKNMYIIDRISKDVFEVYEVDFDRMMLVNPKKIVEEHAFFVSSKLKCAAIGKQGMWAESGTQDEKERSANFRGRYSIKKKGSSSTTDLWYFPHDCLIIE